MIGGDASTVPGALTLSGGPTVPPEDGRVLTFGRNRLEVDVCVGEDDLQVSRVHGLLTCQRGQWWLDCVGRTPIRLPNSILLHGDAEPVLLSPGYTAIHVRGSRGREHLLELYIAGAAGRRPPSRPVDETEKPKRWRLT